MIIQALLVTVSISILIYFLANRNTIKVRAYKKIAIFVFVIAMIAFILNPESLNSIAGWVGVGRGADLLLYTLFVAFVVSIINVYMKFKEYQDKLYRLARRIAILEAQNQEKRGRKDV